MLSVILMVTADKYELPVFCADNADELYREFGIPVSSVWDCIRNDRIYKKKWKFVKVELDGEDE